MSEKFELMQQALKVAETAKDAMGSSPFADKTTESLARTILDEAKRLLPAHRVVQSLALESGPLWPSVRSAMQAVAEALSADSSKSLDHTVVATGGPHGWMR